MTAPLRNLFLCPVTLSMKNLCLIANPILPYRHFILFPRVLLLVTKERRSVPAPLLPHVKKSWAIMSALSLLFSRLNKPRDFSYSSYSPCSTLFITLWSWWPRRPPIGTSLTICQWYHLGWIWLFEPGSSSASWPLGVLLWEWMHVFNFRVCVPAWKAL